MNERYKASKVILALSTEEIIRPIQALRPLTSFMMVLVKHSATSRLLSTCSSLHRPKIQISYFRIEVTEKPIKFKQGNQS